MKPLLCSLLMIATASALALAQAPNRGAVAARLQPFVDHGVIAGAVTLVASKDAVLDLETVGFADLEAKKAMQPDTVFWIASMGKPICATALMMLVDEGKVSVDDPVEKYLPEFKGQMLQETPEATPHAPAHPILVREILSHTSGLPFASKGEHPTFDLLPMADAVKSYAATPLQWEPGTHFNYSNAGINTAGRIIEVVSGMSYEEFLQERLLGPLGMKDTTFHPDAGQIARLALSYHPDKVTGVLNPIEVKQLKYPLDGPGRYPFPAGGLFSTAADLEQFGRMILNRGTLDGKRYLSEAAVHEMTRKQTGSLPNGYGFGWSVSGPTFGHGGAYQTNLNIDPTHNMVAVFLIQKTDSGPGEEGKHVLPSFTEEAVRIASGSATAAPSTATPLIGSDRPPMP